MANFRARTLTKPIHSWAKTALPKLSETEREAMQAGEVWWDAELFSGNPDWSELHAVKAPELNERERQFLENQCNKLCAMIDDWSINQYEGDLPPEVWQFMRDNWLSNRVFKSYDDIVNLSCEAWNKLIDQPWTIMSIGQRKWAHGF